MSVPEHQHLIDPLSERLGALGADVTAVRDRLGRIEATMATKAELRVWGSLVALLLAAALAAVGGLYLRIADVAARLPH